MQEITVELLTRFIKSLESLGSVESELEHKKLAEELGLTGPEDLDRITKMLHPNFIEGIFGDKGTRLKFYQLTESGLEVASGEFTLELGSTEDQETLNVQENDDQVSIIDVDNLTRMLGYVFSQKGGLPATLLDHKLISKRLNYSTAEVEQLISSLIEGGFLEITDEKLVVTEAGIPYATGELKIEFQTAEPEDISNEDLSGVSSGTDVVYEDTVTEIENYFVSNTLQGVDEKEEKAALLAELVEENRRHNTVVRGGSKSGFRDAAE